MKTPPVKKRVLVVAGSMGVSLILTLACVIAYNLDLESFSFARYPLIPGALLVWTICGDNFGGAAEFDRWAILFAFAVNVIVAVCLGLVVSLAVQHRVSAGGTGS